MGRTPNAAGERIRLIQPTTMTVITPMNQGRPSSAARAIDGALKRRRALAVLGTELRDSIDIVSSI